VTGLSARAVGEFHNRFLQTLKFAAAIAATTIVVAAPRRQASTELRRAIHNTSENRL